MSAKQDEMSATRTQMITDQELKELVASLAIGHQHLLRDMKETDRRMQETDRRMQATDRQISRLEQQIGGLGSKFGSFTEGLAFDSMEKILHEQFNARAITPRYGLRKNGENLEVDVFAYRSHPDPAVFIVEVKSHLREKHIAQTLRIIEQFPKMDEWHADKPILGILAGVDIPKNLPQKVWNAGLYLARISGDQFCVTVPDEFQPRRFNVTVHVPL
jgi:hypothetical protein